LSGTLQPTRIPQRVEVSLRMRFFPKEPVTFPRREDCSACSAPPR
jgi:hypothetical protein